MPQRLGILVGVLALHAGLLLLVVLGSRAPDPVAAALAPVEVRFIPPETTPRIRAPTSRPEHLHTDLLPVESPRLSDSPLVPGTSEGANRRESGVDWTAEAHRAVRAYEIRRDEAPTKALSVSALGEEWPTRGLHSNAPSRTANGDWIVWIDANCYQVATGTARTAADTMRPDTQCLREEPPEGRD